MTEGSQAVGAPARVDTFAHIDTYERLRAAALRLGQVLRLHQAEAGRAWSAGTGMTSRDVAEAWTGATELLAQAVADLRGAETTMTAQIADVLSALRDAEDAG